MNAPDPRQIFALDRRAVAQAFDRASASYDAAAALQERVRNELIERLEELKLAPRTILDLGAGTGHASRALKRRYPEALRWRPDIAPGMLARARQQSRWLRRFERVRADAYSLPFRDGAFDLVFSSLMLQWCDDLDAVFAEIARVLKPGGAAVVQHLRPRHAGRVARGLGASDAPSNHVNHFFDRARARQRAHACGACASRCSTSIASSIGYPGRAHADARAQGHRRAQRDARPRARTHRAQAARGHDAAPTKRCAAMENCPRPGK